MAIGVALIGSGIFAKEEHLPAVQNTPSLSLRAVYSRSVKSARALSENLAGIDLYSDDSDGKKYEDLLKRDDIKGVIIALPINAQPEYIKKALTAGKHVLAEKPVAKDVATAQDLISWAKNPVNTRATYSVAENFRFLDSFLYGAEQVAQLGRILSFRTRVTFLITPGGEYYETSWRKVPEYQGGFLLDGGVHFAAATRLLLRAGGEKIEKISAFTAQVQEYLSPADTLNAAVQITNKTSGTLSISFGTTDAGLEYLVACEKGTVQVSRGKAVVTKDGKVRQEKVFQEEGSGVKQEVKAWAQSLESGKQDTRQSSDEALRDLEVIEAALVSGQKGGSPVDLRLQ